MKRIAPLLALLAALVPAAARAQFVRPQNDTVRRLLLESSPAATERQVFLYQHFAAGGLTNQHVGEVQIAVPYGDNRYACYIFSKNGGAIPAAYLGRLADCVPMVNRPITDANVAKVGTWVGNIADAGAYGGFYVRSLTAGDTISSDGGSNKLVGHSLFVHLINISNAGFATVSIDGDFQAANRLPAVTQAEVDSGWFVGGDIGKRYLDTYLSVTDTDSVVCLAEGLTDAAHTITLRVQGTKRPASADTRLYVTAFAAASALTKPTDANATLGAVRYVADPRGGVSSIVTVPQYAPNSNPSNFQFLGEGHGNDALVSEAWTVDGVAGPGTNGAPNVGTLIAGQEVRLERTFTFNHPNASACATRRHVVTAKAGDPYQLRSANQVRWATAGSLSTFYMGMLPLGQLNPAGAPTFVQSGFNRIRIGDSFQAMPALNDGGLNPNLPRTNYFAVCSTAHDTVVACAVPRVDLAMAGFAFNGGTFFQDRSDGQDKVYLYRISNVLEPVVAGQVHSWETVYRLFRVADAANRLAE